MAKEDKKPTIVSHDITAINLQAISEIISSLDWLDDFGTFDEKEQKEIMQKNPDLMDVLYAVKIKLDHLPLKKLV